MPIDPVRGSGAGASQTAASAQEPQAGSESPRAGQRRSAADAGLEELGSASRAPRISAEEPAPRGGALPRRPTTPELESAVRQRPPLIIGHSARHALEQPQVQQRLQAQGIALVSHAVSAEGQATTRPSTVTPLLEEARINAEPIASQLAPTYAARFSAYRAAEALHGLDAADAQGQPLTQDDGAPVKLGQATPANAVRRSAINGLARTYVAAADSAQGSEARLSQAQRDDFLRRGTLAVTLAFQARLHALVDAAGDEGLRAVALLTHAFPEPLTGKASQHRGALLAALEVSPSSVQRLIDAVHRGQQTPVAEGESLAAACEVLCESASASPHSRLRAEEISYVRHALAGLAPAADGTQGPGLHWLLVQSPSPGITRAMPLAPAASSAPQPLGHVFDALFDPASASGAGLVAPTLPEPTRATLELPPRPTSPDLIAMTRTAGRATVLASAANALADPSRRRQLEQQGISTQAWDIDARGALHLRQAQLTPLMEQAERDAAPVAQQMTPAAGALYTAAAVAGALRRLPAYGNSGSALHDADGRHRTLGRRPADADTDGPTLARDNVRNDESTSINRLATAYVADVDEAAFPQPRLSHAQRLNLREGRLARALQFQSRVADLVSALGDEGPRAAAFLTHAVPLRESGDVDARATSSKLAHARSGLLEALRSRPDTVQRFVDAAHRGLTEEHACEEVAREGALLGTELVAGTDSSSRQSAPGRGRLEDLRAALDVLAQPDSPGMQWLLEQAPVP
jgi:hypothetical protein